MKGKLQLYADDSTLVYIANELDTLKEYMAHDIQLLIEYFSDNHMKINLDKTNFIIFSLRGASPDINLEINNTRLGQVKSSRYLGIVIDENLKWNLHITSICSAITPYIFALRKIRYCISKKVAWNISYAFIYPRLLYMNLIWGSTCTVHLNCLVVLQNKSIKIIKKIVLQLIFTQIMFFLFLCCISLKSVYLFIKLQKALSNQILN